MRDEHQVREVTSVAEQHEPFVDLLQKTLVHHALHRKPRLVVQMAPTLSIHVLLKLNDRHTRLLQNTRMQLHFVDQPLA